MRRCPAIGPESTAAGRAARARGGGGCQSDHPPRPTVASVTWKRTSPRECLPPLDLADGHLDEQKPRTRRRSESSTRARLRSTTEQRQEGEEPRRRRAPWRRCGCGRPRSTSPKRTMSSPPECGPAAVTSVPVTTSASAAGTSASGEPRGSERGLRGVPRAMSPAPRARRRRRSRAPRARAGSGP